MNRCCKRTFYLTALVVMCCIAMAVIETVVEPAYFVKSLLKIVLFLIVPVAFFKLQKEKIFSNSFVLNKKSILKLLLLGIAIYLIIMAAFFITKNVFDYSSLVASLSSDQNVSPQSFIWVALYISFCNSFLEEFLFRFVAFLKLSEYIPKTAACIFSALAFSVYHIAMIGSSFPIPLLLLSLVGLAAGGVIFNYIDAKNRNIYNSWIVHMFADFAIMTIWFLYIT